MVNGQCLAKVTICLDKLLFCGHFDQRLLISDRKKISHHYISSGQASFLTRECPKGISLSYHCGVEISMQMNHLLKVDHLQFERLCCLIWKRHIVVVAEVYFGQLKCAFTHTTSWENTGNSVVTHHICYGNINSTRCWVYQFRWSCTAMQYKLYIVCYEYLDHKHCWDGLNFQ